MMKRIFQISIIAVFALMTLSFTAGDGVTLRLRPIKDKVYVINSKTTQTTVMKVQGQTMRNSQTLEGRQTFIAKEVSTDKNVFESQINAIKMTISAMGMNMTYDSEHPETNSPMLADQTKEIEQILNKTNTLTYNELGHNANSDSQELNQLNNAIVELPEKELSIGSQWSFVKTQNVSDNDINVNMTYTVTGITKKSVEVSFTGTIDSKDITGSYDGTASISLRTGIVMSSTTNSTISMTISEQGFEIPTTTTGTSTVNVKEQ